MKKGKRQKSPSTKRNESRLMVIKRLVDRWSNCTEEFKLALKLYIDELIVDIRNRRIVRYHDLIDYLSKKAEKNIDNNEELAEEEKLFLKIVVKLKAELLKRWPYVKKSFWPGSSRGRILRRR